MNPKQMMTLMKVFKLLGPALVVAGVVLLYFGYQAHNAAASQVKSFFTGSPTDQAMHYIVGGVVCLVLGLGLGGKGFLSKAKG